ncbi:hypothetical protein QQ008_15185 [Fulvivirgaceae bacterium BMA10]|uniref:Lipocalin-like domain-containing protein n=1 Tax=Splendidivirga corallicola TaxID=3051826 RepID=A0ABT8KPQ4_9BACT|nr:hypothetical protein [Fulvivirgaceae bacterium BMA10]
MNRLLILIFFMVITLYANGQSKSDFVKKWNIEGYIYLGMTFAPEEHEKNDYIHFLNDGTFNSAEAGKIEKGTWEWKADEKTMYLSQSEETLALKVVKVKEDELILLIEEDGESIKIKYKRSA